MIIDTKIGDESDERRDFDHDSSHNKHNNTVYRSDRYLACEKTGMFDAWQRWMVDGGVRPVARWVIVDGPDNERGAVGPFAGPLFRHSVPCPRNWAARASSVELARLRCVQPSKGFAFVPGIEGFRDALWLCTFRQFSRIRFHIADRWNDRDFDIPRINRWNEKGIWYDVCISFSRIKEIDIHDLIIVRQWETFNDYLRIRLVVILDRILILTLPKTGAKLFAIG